MSMNTKSAAGRLYYTFGTIFLMAVITVCAMNFVQDSRLLNKPAVAASVNGAADVPAASGKTPVGKDGGTKKSETKPGETKPAQTKPAGTNPVKSEPTGTSDNSDSGRNDNKPVNPGEEP